MIPPHKPLVYIISAPSGSGKSTLVNELLKLVPDLDFSISYTTRAPRGSEQNGKQYHFVPREEFELMIRADEFLEHANVFGNYYGTARRFLKEAEAKGHDLLLDIDVQGAKQVQHKVPAAVSIFVLPPDRKTLEWRLRKRSEDAEDVIQRRLVTASGEIENYDRYNYILINDDLEESVESLQAIVMSERWRQADRSLSPEEQGSADLAERCRLANVADRVRPILASFGAASSARS
ncbi:MAG TPA: guanylate kinase [Candidatus Sulfotelmatobacter sp.]|nr:guanylate kinase [Candidatus Sulfotelmatobacter sp.]